MVSSRCYEGGALRLRVESLKFSSGVWGLKQCCFRVLPESLHPTPAEDKTSAHAGAHHEAPIQHQQGDTRFCPY